MLLADFSSDCELFLSLQFGSAGTDDIETAGVSVCIDILVIKNKIIVFDQTARTVLEAVQYVLLGWLPLMHRINRR